MLWKIQFKLDTDISGSFEVKNDRFRVIGQVTIRPGGHYEAYLHQSQSFTYFGEI